MVPLPLTRRVEILEEKMTGFESFQVEMRREFAAVHEELRSMRLELGTHGQELRALREDVETLRRDFVTRTDFETLRTDFATRTDFETLRRDVLAQFGDLGTQMRILHEDTLDKIAKLHNGRTAVQPRKLRGPRKRR